MAMASRMAAAVVGLIWMSLNAAALPNWSWSLSPPRTIRPLTMRLPMSASLFLSEANAKHLAKCTFSEARRALRRTSCLSTTSPSIHVPMRFCLAPSSLIACWASGLSRTSLLVRSLAISASGGRVAPSPAILERCWSPKPCGIVAKFSKALLASFRSRNVDL